jgi:hypothetical protein
MLNSSYVFLFYFARLGNSSTQPDIAILLLGLSGKSSFLCDTFSDLYPVFCRTDMNSCQYTVRIATVYSMSTKI